MTKQSSNKSICQWPFHFRRQYPPFHLWLLWVWAPMPIVQKILQLGGTAKRDEPSLEARKVLLFPLYRWEFSFPIESVFSRFLEQFDISYCLYMPLLFFTPSPLLLIACGCEQEFWDQCSPFSSPFFLATLESLPSHKLQILGRVSLLASLKISIREHDRIPSTRCFNGERPQSDKGNRSARPTVSEGLNGAVTWEVF